MTEYVLAQLTITDRPAYDRYREKFLPTLTPFGGRLLAADEHPEILEGDWSGDKIVLIAFEHKKRLHQWLESPAYFQIAIDRREGAQGPVLLIRGI